MVFLKFSGLQVVEAHARLANARLANLFLAPTPAPFTNLFSMVLFETLNIVRLTNLRG